MLSFDPQIIIEKLRELPVAARYRVAFSGGLDSTVLLHALAAQRDQLPGPLQAIHVNHGLHPEAEAWQRQCEAVCRALGVKFVSEVVQVNVDKGGSLEAVARERRYAAFAKLMQPGDYLLLAQHLDDQLETFLLQALRGTGLAGLAAMPAAADFASGRLVRPLLDVTRAALSAWAHQQKLAWVDDPGNQELRFDRNYLRHEVLPRLKHRWPSAAETVARTARHCAEAMELLTIQAADDLKQYGIPDGYSLALQAVRDLSRPRAKQLLRHWLAQHGFVPPPAHKLEQVFTDILTAGSDRTPCLDWPGAELRRYRDRLYVQRPLPELPGSFRIRAGEYRDLGPGLGRLGLLPAETGIRAAACPDAGLQVSFRVGGELCQPAGQAHRRPLKKWLQELEVLPWMRTYLPLLKQGDELVGVAGLFTCDSWQALPGEPALRVVWEQAPMFLGENKKTADFEGESSPAAS
ncbi:MAG TPA: tRNA lysidine(34) synthetase TilS [Gammaproteobacteria bacterium]|jgi:tRNA(Ile)-lysidine synthase|nr:tRNA lysidine(34) synthetase TilS [Gammaproteobacteria bacterium]